jgi:pimeloyl-ACP methyl ester carboxylesterase
MLVSAGRGIRQLAALGSARLVPTSADMRLWQLPLALEGRAAVVLGRLMCGGRVDRQVIVPHWLSVSVWHHRRMMGFLHGVTQRQLVRPDGRVVAWSEWGGPDGRPMLRVPGTPGCRFSLRADRARWTERGLWMVTTERPGFGASSPLPGRGFAEPADDLAAILDEIGIDRIHVIGGSGAAPHQLAFAARHPGRVRAMTVVVGAAPVEEVDVDQMIGLNQRSWRLARSGDQEGLRALVQSVRAEMLADPLASFAAIMDRAPEADRAVMSDPGWQKAWVVATREALRQGADGWTDEVLALAGDWRDVDLAAISTTITWWHAAGDANAPLSAARRIVERLPRATLRLFGQHEGHLAAYHREGEILDELLARG